MLKVIGMLTIQILFPKEYMCQNFTCATSRKQKNAFYRNTCFIETPGIAKIIFKKSIGTSVSIFRFTVKLHVDLPPGLQKLITGAIISPASHMQVGPGPRHPDLRCWRPDWPLSPLLHKACFYSIILKGTFFNVHSF